MTANMACKLTEACEKCKPFLHEVVLNFFRASCRSLPPRFTLFDSMTARFSTLLIRPAPEHRAATSRSEAGNEDHPSLSSSGSAPAV